MYDEWRILFSISTCCMEKIIIVTGKSCGSPGEIEGATMVGSYLYGDEVTYICRHNYIMAEGNDTLRCQEDQTWSGVRPRCVREREKFTGRFSE